MFKLFENESFNLFGLFQEKQEAEEESSGTKLQNANETERTSSQFE